MKMLDLPTSNEYCVYTPYRNTIFIQCPHDAVKEYSVTLNPGHVNDGIDDDPWVGYLCCKHCYDALFGAMLNDFADKFGALRKIVK